VWAPVKVPAGKMKTNYNAFLFDFNDRFGRGNLVGINQEQVSAVLNTGRQDWRNR